MTDHREWYEGNVARLITAKQREYVELGGDIDEEMRRLTEMRQQHEALGAEIVALRKEYRKSTEGEAE
ncbi:hypothetical protein [Alteribacter populi]|uniref:hypothetical protein n=1 Tax=Alteribacter populi TaxID=2011011 RepID=UPI0012FFD080|nr:hypothetical protein [Alteribacter populi]